MFVKTVVLHHPSSAIPPSPSINRFKEMMVKYSIKMQLRSYIEEQITDALFQFSIPLFDCHYLPSTILDYCLESFEDQYDLCLGIVSCLPQMDINENNMQSYINQRFQLSFPAFDYLQTCFINCYKNVLQAQCKFCNTCHFSSSHSILYCKCHLHNELWFLMKKDLEECKTCRLFLSQINASICDYQSYYCKKITPFLLGALSMQCKPSWIRACKEITGDNHTKRNQIVCGLFFYTAWQYISRIQSHLQGFLRYKSFEDQKASSSTIRIYNAQIEGVQSEQDELIKMINHSKEQEHQCNHFLYQCKTFLQTEVVEKQCQLYEQCIKHLQNIQEESKERLIMLCKEISQIKSYIEEEEHKLQEQMEHYFLELCIDSQQTTEQYPFFEDTCFICSKEMMMTLNT